MAKYKIRVNIDPETGEVKVTQSPKAKKVGRRVLPYVLGKDSVRFSGNLNGTAIKFTKSPFAGLGAGRVLKDLERSKGPFKVMTGDGFGEIKCGHVVGRTFKQWGRTGDFIPPC